MPNVNIAVPITTEYPGRPPLFLGEELATSNFTAEAKVTANRILAGMLAAGTTLADGAPVNSVDRVFQWLVEAVKAAE